jgi:two-component system, NtrC family, sensor histidine kinase KinB
MTEIDQHKGERSSAEQLKETFIALISDDLLTPLAAIRAAAELIDKLDGQGAPKQAVRQCVAGILESTTRLTSMVEDLLDISRIEDGSFPVAARPISLQDFLPELLTRLALPLEGRQLDLVLEKRMPLAWADPDLLERVMKNLLTTAIKHSTVGGVVLLKALGIDGKILVSVTDRGPGIAAEHLPSALAKLCRPPAGGLGLCLYITKRAVEALGGQIQVESEPGLGSTFTFSLPCSPLPRKE